MARFTSENQPKKNGRPKGSIGIAKLIRKVWEEEVKDDEGNYKLRALISIKAMMDKCDSGDVGAFRALVERMEGMPKQIVETREYKYEDLKDKTLEELEEIRDSFQEG